MKDKMYVAFKVSLRIKIVGIKIHKSHIYIIGGFSESGIFDVH